MQRFVAGERAQKDARDRARWARTSMARYERRVADAPTKLAAAQAKRDRKAAKRAGTAVDGTVMAVREVIR
ncbi:hypothetical protein [Bradyrhizobium sp. RT10b]|uniref:hypothetical protein n=1 Tax=Bradyrhizobium sp. RT10b TaxID=3156331 RepID=UPI003398FA56